MSQIIKDNCLDYKEESQEWQVSEDKVNSNLKIFQSLYKNGKAQDKVDNSFSAVYIFE